MTTASSTPSPQRRLAACCEGGTTSDDDDNAGKCCSPASPSSPSSPFPTRSSSTPGLRLRASLPALLAKLLSLAALSIFLSAAVHDSAKSSNNLKVLKSAAASSKTPFVPPWFCHERPCPAFDVLASPSPDSYSVRRYRGDPQRRTWVRVSNLNVSTYEAAYAAGGLAIAAYTRGDNAEGRRLTSLAGAPTLVSFSTDDDFSSAEDSYSVSMFLATELGPDGTTVVPPPQPSNSSSAEGEGRMTIEVETGEKTIYVVQFGGFATGRASLGNAARLALALERDGLPYVKRRMELAIYDPPTRFAQRHNEVWLLEEEEEEEEAVGVEVEEEEEGKEGKEKQKKMKKKHHQQRIEKVKSRKNRKSGGDVGVATAFAA